MTTKTIYHFDNSTDTGINLLPVQSLVQARNIDTAAPVQYFTLLSKANMSHTTTILDAVSNTQLTRIISLNMILEYDDSNNEMNIIIKDI